MPDRSRGRSVATAVYNSMIWFCATLWALDIALTIGADLPADDDIVSTLRGGLAVLSVAAVVTRATHAIAIRLDQNRQAYTDAIADVRRLIEGGADRAVDDRLDALADRFDGTVTRIRPTSRT